MTEDIRKKVHWTFWLIGALAFVWNGGGLVNFFVQMNPDMIAAYRESERAIIEGRPMWATASFFVAMASGLIASVLLLIKRSAAFHLFVVSLLGVIVTTIHTLGVDIEFSAGEMVVIVLMPTVVAAFLAWYARHTAQRGWIR